MRRARMSLVLAALLAGAGAAPARADLTEWPTCSLPLSADQAFCEDGRSPNRLVTGPDGGVWFTTYGGQEVGRVTPGGALVMYDLPPVPGVPAGASRRPYGITVGPDGALWFTEDFGNRIGRVTTSGTFTFFEDPGARPQDIALGPDGALWITESGTNSIGRLTPTGVFSHVALAPVTAPGNTLMRITRGPDGRMWFAEQIRGAIGAITMGGTVTERILPTGWRPQSLVAGPDGAIWFSAFPKGIGRLTTSGALKLMPLPGAGAASITVGPDGALWVGEGIAAGLLRVTTAGAVTETPLLSGAIVNDVTAGPDGAIWFVETGNNRIGRLGAGVGAGPTVTGVAPAGGSPYGGSTVTIAGAHLSGARQVRFGDAPAAGFSVLGSTRIRATSPPHVTGPVRITVTAGGRTSPGTDAGLFTFGDPATIAPVASTVASATTVAPQRPRLEGSTLVVPVRADGAATLKLTVALPAPARSAATGTAVPRTLGRAETRIARAGRAAVRVRLTAAARRALTRARRAHRTLFVAARATGADRRVSVRQRGDRLR